MPKQSSRSATSIYRDKEGILQSLRQAAQAALDRHPELLCVILFGSFARGDYGLYSDADVLLVLKRSRRRRFFDRIPDYIEDFLPAWVPVDVFPYTESELQQMVEDGNQLICGALSEGLVLAEREPKVATDGV